MKLMMKYSKLTTNSNNFIKKFSHLQRFNICKDIIKKYQFKNFLDYGAGDGQLIKLLSKDYKNFVFHLYEPDKKMLLQIKKNLREIKKKIFYNRKKLKNAYYDIICINEVFEHLNQSEINETIKILKKIIKKKGTIVISVPIEVGLGGFLKNLIRVLIKQKHANTNFVNIIKSLLFLEVKRPNLKYNPSHIGFNYINFIKILKKHKLNITKIRYSPFGIFYGLINSQVYMEANFK